MVKRGNKWPGIWKRRLCALLLTAVLAVFVIPPAVLLAVVHQHIDYRGNTPLKEVHAAADYGLTEIVHTLETADGETLWCAEVAAEEPKAAVIFLAGITKPSVTQFYGHAAWLRELGFSSFLLEVRAHGYSSGNRIGLGYTETADVQAAVEAIRSRPEYGEVPLLVWGVSMGGAIALNAFGRIPEIDGCIAMSPYASFPMEIETQMKRYGVPKPIRDLELWMLDGILTRLYGAETVETCAPEVQIQNAGERPVLLVACEKDLVVPVGNTYHLQAQNPAAEVWIRDSNDHFVVNDNDFVVFREDAAYCGRILTWLAEQGFAEA